MKREKNNFGTKYQKSRNSTYYCREKFIDAEVKTLPDLFFYIIPFYFSFCLTFSSPEKSDKKEAWVFGGVAKTVYKPYLLFLLRHLFSTFFSFTTLLLSFLNDIIAYFVFVSWCQLMS